MRTRRRGPTARSSPDRGWFSDRGPSSRVDLRRQASSPGSRARVRSVVRHVNVGQLGGRTRRSAAVERRLLAERASPRQQPGTVTRGSERAVSRPVLAYCSPPDFRPDSLGGIQEQTLRRQFAPVSACRSRRPNAAGHIQVRQVDGERSAGVRQHQAAAARSLRTPQPLSPQNVWKGNGRVPSRLSDSGVPMMPNLVPVDAIVRLRRHADVTFAPWLNHQKSLAHLNESRSRFAAA